MQRQTVLYWLGKCYKLGWEMMAASFTDANTCTGHVINNDAIANTCK